MKYFLITAILLSTSVSTVAQEDVKTKHAAYYLCIDHIEKDPNKAYEYCRDYLNKYPNDDRRLVDFAGKFITAHKKISQYVQSVPRSYFEEITTSWAVYSPGLLATIPVEDSRDAKHPILIKREYGSPDEERLLAKAESLLLKQWRYITKDVVFPDGQPKWWTGTMDTILATELVTTEASLYYYNL